MRSIKDVLAALEKRLPPTAQAMSTTPSGATTPESSPIPLAAIVRPGELPPDACPLCKGAGYLRVPAPLGGNTVETCSCMKTRQRDAAWRDGIAAANIGPGDSENTLAGFDPAYQPEAFRLASSFARSPDRWLVLYGVTGSGKTHLLTAMANELIRRERRPLYWIVPDLIRHLQDGYADHTYTARLDAVRGADVLLLDEWGLNRTTTDRDEMLFAILNHRIGWRLPTAIGTNLRPRDMPPRIRSRLNDGEYVDGVVLRPFDYRTGETITDVEAP